MIASLEGGRKLANRQVTCGKPDAMRAKEMLRICALTFLMLFPAFAASGQDLTASFPPGYGPAPTIDLPPDLFPPVNSPAVQVYLKNRTWVQIRDFLRPENSEGFEYQATLYGAWDSRSEKIIAVFIGGAHRDYIDRN